MPARMTATALGRGAINALIWGLIFLVGWLLVAMMISSVSHQPRTVSFWLAWSFLWGLIFLLFLGTWLYGLNSGGRVLLDCGPHPTRVAFLINAVLFLALGLGGTLAVSSLPKSFAIASPVLGISFGIYWLILASGRLQIREGGLWQYWGLLRWDKIESCRWSGDSTLMVKAKTHLPFLGRAHCPFRQRTSKPSMNCCRNTAGSGIVTSSSVTLTCQSFWAGKKDQPDARSMTLT